MNSEKWQQAKQLYEAALKVGSDERARFLDENSGGDEELRLEVESLLACSDDASGFMEKPVIGEVAEAIVSRRSLAGKKILQYNIIELIGAGGMGEVYLAEDTRLRRKVGLKILPQSLSENQRFVQRFEREACAASALNHPNILTVHEIGEKDGIRFIASEYVKGKTLRERFQNEEAMDLTEALDIVLQVAAALRAAHGSNIVHRDIKPENIMIRDDGIVKVLDFGLAKLEEDRSGPVDSRIETLITTTPGMIMGTAAYMSPEQARGRVTDTRTDIWSLGVVLYEILAGRLPFEGETASDTMASILVREAKALDNLPAELNEILGKALQKDVEKRYQSIDELIPDLENFSQSHDLASLWVKRGVMRSSGGDTLANRPASDTILVNRKQLQSTNRKLIVSYILLSIITVGAFIFAFYPRKNSLIASNPLASYRNLDRVIMWNPEAGGDEIGARFSPNGMFIAYVFADNDRSNIFTLQVPNGKPNKITDSKWDYYNPIWSPDNRRIAFISNKDGRLGIWSMLFSGGDLTFIAKVENPTTSLLKWSRNGNKIYYQEGDAKAGLNVFVLDLDSKQVARITNFDPGEGAQFFSISPNEDQIAYSSGEEERLHIFVLPIKGGTPQQVTKDSGTNDEYPFWMPDGKQIIYSSMRDGVFQSRMAYLDEDRTELINFDISDRLIVDVSSDGRRILFQQSGEESNIWKIGIDDKNEDQITTKAGLELWPDVSSDGKSIVFQSTTEAKHLLEGSITVHSDGDDQDVDIAANGYAPAFSPDGQKVAFLRDKNNITNLWITGPNGGGDQPFTTGGIWFPGYTEVPYNRTQVRDFRWSPDGKSLVFCEKKDGLWNFWRAPVDGSGPPLRLSDNRDENIGLYSPALSSDGKRTAWTSLSMKTEPDGPNPTALYVNNGEKVDVIYRSDLIIKLIGWSGDDLVVALPDEQSTAKPVRVTLKLISPDGRKRDIVSIGEVYFNNIQISPDGRRIALVTREKRRDNIRIISVRDGANKPVTINTDPTLYISGIAWSPDNRSVYFAKQRLNGTIWMIEKSD